MPGIDFVAAARPLLDDRVKSAFQVFVNVAIPAAVAGVPPAIVLETNAEGWKTPVIASNPNAVYLGCSTEGWDLALDKQTQDEFCDEQVDPESTTTTSRKLTIAGNLLGVLDEKILTTLYGLTKWHVDSDTFQHYGDAGDVTNPTMSVLAVWRRLVGGTYKYGYFFFPNAEQTAAYPTGKLSSKQRILAPVSFTAKGYPGYGGRSYTKYFEE